MRCAITIPQNTQKVWDPLEKYFFKCLMQYYCKVGVSDTHVRLRNNHKNEEISLQPDHSKASKDCT